jgi:hypothetical protein
MRGCALLRKSGNGRLGIRSLKQSVKCDLPGYELGRPDFETLLGMQIMNNDVDGF